MWVWVVFTKNNFTLGLHHLFEKISKNLILAFGANTKQWGEDLQIFTLFFRFYPTVCSTYLTINVKCRWTLDEQFELLTFFFFQTVEGLGWENWQGRMKNNYIFLHFLCVWYRIRRTFQSNALFSTSCTIC